MPTKIEAFFRLIDRNLNAALLILIVTTEKQMSTGFNQTSAYFKAAADASEVNAKQSLGVHSVFRYNVSLNWRLPMTDLNNKEIEKIAHLARLNISDNDVETLSNKLNNILKLVDKMNSVNTDNVAAVAHPFDENQPLRDDQISEDNQRDIFQKNAPLVEAGLYIVPTVIETE